MRQTITATSLPLYSLGAFGDVLSRCDSQRFSTLVELTLALLTSGDLIGTVLIHCTRIQSLTLIVSDAYEGDVAAALRTHSDPLPLLTAFQVFYPRMGRKMSESMVSFLRNKLLLERLDMGLHEWPKAFDDI
ncbi:hypothetical protein GSI_12092 [Ganoderma sinense ZZ0214-1]|uniref:Uncharacterized protein n=1 Tax=Ganoderma sinense ZZ0214-1 TaxID=1077348 RepID=A0A2G8RXU2_9APHY|nr:hypothetical protein GSI_12092 [Ganoderma sinense ZZ0214-1]